MQFRLPNPATFIIKLLGWHQFSLVRKITQAKPEQLGKKKRRDCRSHSEPAFPQAIVWLSSSVEQLWAPDNNWRSQGLKYFM